MNTYATAQSKLNKLVGITKTDTVNIFKTSNNMELVKINTGNIAKAENLGMSEISILSNKELKLIVELNLVEDYNYLINELNRYVDRFLKAIEINNYDLASDCNETIKRLNNRMINIANSCYV